MSDFNRDSADDLYGLLNIIGKERLLDARSKAISTLTRQVVTVDGKLFGGKLTITVDFTPGEGEA